MLFNGALTETTLDVSACSQIRVTASAGKEGSGSVFLWDASSLDILAAPLVLALDATTSYKSALLETPGTLLTLDGFGSPAPPVVAIYCR